MFINFTRLLAYPVLACVLFSCHSNNAKTPAANTGTNVREHSTERELSTEVKEAPPADSVYKNYPIDTIYPARILTTGEYHEDEVRKDDKLRNWYGLFMNKDGYYLDSTPITTKNVEDPLGDEGNKTGWEVKANHIDTALFLISGVEGLSGRKIGSVKIAKQEILPDESTTFSYNGITYTIYATGNKGPGGDSYITTSYRLFIKATINGSRRQQLLVSIKEFDDAMIKILFAGDIDGDGFPDFILDTISHYNGARPTLYLSKPAGGEKLLKVMGMHVSVGC